MIEIDQHAKARAVILGMPPDVLVPIGARDRYAVLRYIGEIDEIAGIAPEKAFIVSPYSIPERNEKLQLWKLKESAVLHSKKQVWVQVDYRNYRAAYTKVFPAECITGYFIDHILNRRVARLKGFHYLRIIPVSPCVNTNSGGVTEKYGFEYHSTERMRQLNSENKAAIEYADKADIIKMLNKKTGGKFQDLIRDSLYLFTEG